MFSCFTQAIGSTRMRIRQVSQFTLFNLFFASYSVHAGIEINLTPGVTPISRDIYHLHMTIFWICVAIGIIVFGTMLYSIIYHRKSRGAKAAHFHEHVWLEITWTLVPFFILIWMAILAVKVLVHMHDESQPDLSIKVTGYQWKWHYEYLDLGVKFFSQLSTPSAQLRNQAPKGIYYLREVDHPLVVPIHKKIRFLITANDVIHSWWVPELGVKQDAIPGFINETWARINRPGIYRGQCAELCGILHAYMPIVVIAVPEKEFNDWLLKQKQPAVTLPSGETASKPTSPAEPVQVKKQVTLADSMKQGEQVYLSACAVCHQPDGKGTPPVFPALKGGKMTTGPVAAHIDVVLHGRTGTAMQAFKDQYNDEDLAAVITYERNTFGNNTGDVVQPADIASARQKS